MERLISWIEYEIERAEMLRSKHAEHYDEGVNAEAWGYFTGYRNALLAILEEVKKHGNV